MRKIAFCFLIYDEILNEDLWYDFFKGVNPDKYSIYIHYKENKTLGWFEKFKLHKDKIVPTKYADISLVRAHRRMFEEAYLDKDNYKFINVSHACIPVKTFDYIYDKMTRDNNSYFNLCAHESSFPRASSTLKYLPKEKIYKSHQWFIVNREHVKLFIDRKGEEHFFEDVYAPEEHHFVTVVKNNLDKDVVYMDDLALGATTFTNWYDEDDIKNYSSISYQELLTLINSDCLFARKFAKNFSVKISHT